MIVALSRPSIRPAADACFDLLAQSWTTGAVEVCRVEKFEVLLGELEIVVGEHPAAVFNSYNSLLRTTVAPSNGAAAAFEDAGFLMRQLSGGPSGVEEDTVAARLLGGSGPGQDMRHSPIRARATSR